MRTTSPLFVIAPIVLAAACSNDTTTGTPQPRIVLEAEVPDASHIDATVSEGEAGVARGTRSASTSPAQLARLGTIPAEATPGISVDLHRVLAGGRTSIEFDVDTDGATETVQVFQATAGPTFLAWLEAAGDGSPDRCYLTFAAQGIGWYFAADCDADGGLICRYQPERTCVLCDARYCAPCTADESDPQRVACEEIVAPVPDAGPDTVSDAGEDVAGDSGDDTTPDDSGGDTSPPDTEPDVPTTDGPCSAACMAFSGAFCCTDCGCTGGSGECLPACSEGFEWDCEIGCCFNYSTFECEGQ